jgi:hypothetical protein
MKAQDISPPENYPHIPKEMERAKYGQIYSTRPQISMISIFLPRGTWITPTRIP